MYEKILADIHDSWFNDIALSASRHILKIAPELTPYKIVDIGCGGGQLLLGIQKNCSAIFGFDISEEMLNKCRIRFPNGTFTESNALDVQLPHCNVVTMVGEVISYAATTPEYSEEVLKNLFYTIYNALDNGGIFLFDALGKEHDYSGSFLHDQDDFTIFSEVQQTEEFISRRIISFLREGAAYQKSLEVHNLRLFDPDFLEKILKEVGFRVKKIDKYDDVRILPGRVAYECRKIM